MEYVLRAETTEINDNRLESAGSSGDEGGVSRSETGVGGGEQARQGRVE